MHPLEVEDIMKTAILLVDTREHEGSKLDARITQAGLSHIRKKLNYGDYSVSVKVDGNIIDFSDKFVIERKMSLDELAMCFCSNRARFTREFERARADGAKVYLLVENSSIDMIMNHMYRSKMIPKSFIGSLITFTARYNCVPVFTNSKRSGFMIRQIIDKELKERLLQLE